MTYRIRWLQLDSCSFSCCEKCFRQLMLKVNWPDLNLSCERFADRSGNRATNINSFNDIMALESVIAWGCPNVIKKILAAAFSIMLVEGRPLNSRNGSTTGSSSSIIGKLIKHLLDHILFFFLFFLPTSTSNRSSKPLLILLHSVSDVRR